MDEDAGCPSMEKQYKTDLLELLDTFLFPPPFLFQFSPLLLYLLPFLSHHHEKLILPGTTVLWESWRLSQWTLSSYQGQGKYAKIACRVFDFAPHFCVLAESRSLLFPED